MSQHQAFQGFFSYSHHDAYTDPKLITAFSEALEARVTAKLTNASFTIWKDDRNLRLGEKWDDRIAQAISASSVLIVILSPKWIESDYCRQEYSFFCSNVEQGFDVGEYVAPLLIRSTDAQQKHFHEEQSNVFKSIKTRQYIKALSTDFLALSEDERTRLVDEVADDVVGMIERLRHLKTSSEEGSQPIVPRRRPKPRAEFDARAHNFQAVDVVSAAEVLVESPSGDELRAVYAHIDFLPRMYVQSANARIEFGIRRALLTLDDGGSGSLYRNNEWGSASDGRQSAYYVTARSAPNAITVCIDPVGDNTTLRELPLPPAAGENRLSKVALAAPHAEVESMRATLSISLTPEGIFIFSADGTQRVSAGTARKIAAIVNAAAEKDASARTGTIERPIPVRERRK